MRKGLAALALCVEGWAGCAAGPHEPAMTPVRDGVLAPEELARRLVAGAPTVENEPGVLLRVAAPIGAAAGAERDLRVLYRFVFLDGAGEALTPEAMWRTQEIPLGATVLLEATAVSPAAADWRLELRPAR